MAPPIRTYVIQAFLPSATKLRRFCFYSCLSVHSGGSASVQVGIPIPPPGPGTPLRTRHPSRTRHPPQETATAADGTHPTGMHSCFKKLSWRQVTSGYISSYICGCISVTPSGTTAVYVFVNYSRITLITCPWTRGKSACSVPSIIFKPSGQSKLL